MGNQNEAGKEVDRRDLDILVFPKMTIPQSSSNFWFSRKDF